jgi:hypothetical protein
MVKELNAIVIEPVPGEKPLAYSYRHNIRWSYVKKFCSDMKRKYPGATHVNFYDKQTRRFAGQVRI